MRPIRFLLLIAALAAGTAALGWWAVPVLAAIWSVVTRNERSHPVAVGLAAALAWLALLAFAATRGPVSTVATTMGGVLQIGTSGVWFVTLLFPALLAGATAAVVRAVTAPAA